MLRLLSLLKSQEQEVRDTASSLLIKLAVSAGASGDGRLLIPLLMVYNTGDTALKAAAQAAVVKLAQTLEEKNDITELLSLAIMTKNASGTIKEAGAKALLSLHAANPSMFPAVIKMLDGKEFESRTSGAVILGILKDARAVAPLTLALGDSSPAVRLAAAKALGEIKDKSVKKDLKKALKDENEQVRQAAKDALANLKRRG